VLVFVILYLNSYLSLSFGGGLVEENVEEEMRRWTSKTHVG